MSPRFSYQGATGDIYHFNLIDALNYQTLPWDGAVLIIAERAPEPFQIMETRNLYGAGMNLQDTLKSSPHLLVYVLIENDTKRREMIVQDLAENHPKMARGW
jgi:hypothetical protein